MTLRLAVFDMVGTTVRAGDEVPASFRNAFRTVGIELSDDAVAAIRGRSKRDAVVDLLAANGGQAEDAERVYRSFQAALRDAYRANARGVEGAVETFQALHASGVAIVLTTGLDRETAELLVASLGWDGPGPLGLDGVITGDDVARGRPAPDLIQAAMAHVGVSDPRDVLAVGDTVSDLEAAAAAGVGLSVGVLTGAHGRDVLEPHPHDALLDSVADLPAWLRSAAAWESGDVTLLLDLDHTLFDPESIPTEVVDFVFAELREANRRLGALDPEVMETSIAALMGTPITLVAQEYGWPEELRKLCFEASAKVTLPDALPLYPDAPPVLELPNRTFLVTTGIPAVQLQKIRALGLEPRVDGVEIDDVTARPRRGKQAIFREILEREGITPAGALVVGDRLSSEIAAGTALGIETVHVARAGCSGACPATYCIPDLGGLAAVLEDVRARCAGPGRHGDPTSGAREGGKGS